MRDAVMWRMVANQRGSEEEGESVTRGMAYHYDGCNSEGVSALHFTAANLCLNSRTSRLSHFSSRNCDGPCEWRTCESSLVGPRWREVRYVAYGDASSFPRASKGPGHHLSLSAGREITASTTEKRGGVGMGEGSEHDPLMGAQELDAVQDMGYHRLAGIDKGKGSCEV